MESKLEQPGPSHRHERPNEERGQAPGIPADVANPEFDPFVCHDIAPRDSLAVLTRREPPLGSGETLVQTDGVIGTRAESLSRRPATWRAFAAFRIGVHPCHLPPADVLQRQLQLMVHLLALPVPEDWAIQLRMTAKPLLSLHSDTAAEESEVEPSLLTMTLLCVAQGSSRAQAIANVRELARAIELGAALVAPAYFFSPVVDRAKLRAFLILPRTRDIVEIGRRPVAEEAAGRVPLRMPLPPRVGNGHWLCQALVSESVASGSELMWAVTMEAASDIGSTRRVLKERVLEAASALDQATQDWEGGRQDWATALTSIAPAHVALRRMEAQWRALAGPAARVQAFLASSSQRIPPSLLAAALTECGATYGTGDPDWGAPPTWLRPIRPLEEKLARRALTDLRCIDWEAAYDFARPGRRGVETGGAGRALAYTRPSQESLTHLADIGQIAVLMRLPIPGPNGLPGVRTQRCPRQVWLADAPRPTSSSIVLGDNVVQGRSQTIALGIDDRRRHVYVVGQTGTGKSTLLLNGIQQDLESGMGLAVLDPHGDLVQRVLRIVPPDRVDDVVILDPGDREAPVGFNLLECANEEERYQVVESFIGMLYQLFDPLHVGIVGPRFEHAARNAMLTAMCGNGLTLVEVVRVLTGAEYRATLREHIDDPLVKSYWEDQIAHTSDFHKSEVLDYIVSKFSPFVHNRLVRNIIGQSHSSFSLREVIDERRILPVNLAQGILGPKLSSFLGMVIVPRLLIAALSRVDMPETQRRDFTLYVDEFQHYATPAFVDLISGARKYGLNVTMAHQHMEQLPGDVRGAILGNVGTIIAFRTGVLDAAILAEAMQPSEFTARNYTEVPNFQAIAQVLSDGRKSPCFTLACRPPDVSSDDARSEWAEHIRALSRERYGRPREAVEKAILRRAAFPVNGRSRTRRA